MLTYNVFDDVLNLRNLVDNFFNEVPLKSRRGEFPYIKLYEGKDELEIKSLVPGIEPEDLDIHLVDSSLIIEGNKKEDYKDDPYLRKERLFGKFKKSIKLPYRVDADSIKADLINGILIIRLMKSEDAKPKKIEIN